SVATSERRSLDELRAEDSMKREAAHGSRAPLAIGNDSRRSFRSDTRPAELRSSRPSRSERADYPPWGPSLSKRACCPDPVTWWSPGGWLLCWVSSQLLFPCRRAAAGQAGAPAAGAPVRARARTNELDARKRRPMIASEESRPDCGLPWAGFDGV